MIYNVAEYVVWWPFVVYKILKNDGSLAIFELSTNEVYRHIDKPTIAIDDDAIRYISRKIAY